MICSNCGKEIADGIAFCPECGKPVMQKQQGESIDSMQNGSTPLEIKKAPYNTMCIIGLVIAVISLFLNFFGIVGIIATVVSVLGLKQVSTNEENGKALAIIGIIIGIFSILYALL